MLAFLNIGTSFSDAHRAANVSTFGVIARMDGVFGMASTSSQPQANIAFHSNIIPNMSGIPPNFHFTPTLEHLIFSAKTVNRESFKTTDWIIDTKATDHVVHSVSCFTSITTTLSSHVNLPDCETTLVTHIGTV